MRFKLKYRAVVALRHTLYAGLSVTTAFVFDLNLICLYFYNECSEKRVWQSAIEKNLAFSVRI